MFQNEFQILTAIIKESYISLSFQTFIEMKSSMGTIFAARIVTNSAYDASALPIIKKLGWPTINELIESETLKMVYKSVNNQAPIYLTEMFVRLSDACKRELRNTKTDLAVPRRKSAFGQKCFSYKGAKLWNDLSVEVKSSKSYEIFKKRINNANTEC